MMVYLSCSFLKYRVKTSSLSTQPINLLCEKDKIVFLKSLKVQS